MYVHAHVYRVNFHFMSVSVCVCTFVIFKCTQFVGIELWHTVLRL